MSVYKEAYKFLDEITDKSVQIYPDAADFGMPICIKTANWFRLNLLSDTYGIPETRQISKNGKEVSIKISLINEWNPPFEKEVFEIHYISCNKGRCKGYDGFVTFHKTY